MCLRVFSMLKTRGLCLCLCLCLCVCVVYVYVCVVYVCVMCNVCVSVVSVV